MPAFADQPSHDKPQREIIEEQAYAVKEKLEERGVKFKEGPGPGV